MYISATFALDATIVVVALLLIVHLPHCLTAITTYQQQHYQNHCGPGWAHFSNPTTVTTEVCRISATRAITCNSLLWTMLSVMSFEVGTSYNAQSVPYMEGNALCCCKDSANLCTTTVCVQYS